ncbi:probable serine hydrolase isoform X2 [Bactrocera dorsalis]|uniref:Probable serine hydrolase isoform X2 n=1 Tax=Bactrocera dorsalis TaxID=27457 RepID=A0A9B2GTQ7_BACDO|nr:probable serine hydrolase isoform X2 [Bactrocera dorsalis]
MGLCLPFSLCNIYYKDLCINPDVEMVSSLGTNVFKMLRRPQFMGTTFIKRYISSAPTTLKDTNYITKHFEEISIPVPWGHLKGKWFGTKNVRPILGLHGWQDNAGTYDTLAPLLPNHLGFLSIDLPGHGHSSWLPMGISYHSIDYVSLLLRVMDYFQWDKISMICHSMSSINGFIFSALFPEKVDMMVGLDGLKPLARTSERIVDNYKSCMNSIILQENRINSSEPPSYDWDELVERLYNGSNKSVERETCKFLLERAVRPSKNNPQKYYFARDSRLKTTYFYSFGEEVPLSLARNINCPYMFIKALQSPYFEPRQHFEKTLEIMKQNPHFEFYEVEGSHHVHLNNPNKIAPMINSFIHKWRSS